MGQYLQLIQDKLAGTDWVVRAGSRDGLVETVAGGAVICVDGRPPKGEVGQSVVRGPKIQGGVEGVALLLVKKAGKAELTKEEFVAACEVVKASGYTPAVHDMGHEPVHCGHCKLLMQDYFAQDMPRLAITPAAMVEETERQGGLHIELSGEHQEEKVVVNFVPKATMEPKYKEFILDAWYAEQVGVELEELLVNAVKTVEGLNGPRVIEVVE